MSVLSDAVLYEEVGEAVEEPASGAETADGMLHRTNEAD
jgi:hypothetical protein